MVAVYSRNKVFAMNPTPDVTKTPGFSFFKRSKVTATIIFVTLFFVFCFSIYAIARDFVIDKAEEEVEDLLLQHRGIHQYIQRNMHPELYHLKDIHKIPQELYSPSLFSSSYMVRNMHNYVNEEREKKGKDRLYYKMAAVNPRNPVNLADAEEERILRMFNENREVKQYREIVEINHRSYLQIALPFLTTNDACLKCHGNREDAPVQLQERYAGMGGFGDKVGNIRAIESIRVPLDERLNLANIMLLAAGIVGMFFLGLVGINYRLGKHVEIQTARLRDSEERFRAAFESARDCIVIWDKDYDCLYANQMAIDHVEATRDMMIGRNIADALGHLPDFKELWTYRIRKVFETGQTQSVADETVINGRFYYTESHVTPVWNPDGSVEAVCIVYRDVTDRKQAEEQLRKLRSYLSNIINSMPSILIGVDTDGNITQWNKQAEKTTGLTPEDAVGKPLAQAVPRLEKELQRIKEAIADREEKQDIKRPRPNANEICYENITVYPLTANGVDGAVIRIDDVTDQVRLEEMMIQSEKMLSVGGLAAGMAHEINNPLASMMQTASVMCGRLTDKNIPANLQAAEEAETNMKAISTFMEKRGIIRMLSDINESGQRVASIVNNMLSFARKSNSIIEQVDIVELIDKTIELARTDYDLKKRYDFKTIEIVREYENDLPLLPCEPAKMQQVLLNILRNAAQALHGCGREKSLIIVRARVEHDRQELCLEIEDNGPGMNEETIRRAFEPFFTTKPVGEGTGLGLSVSYFIVTESHQGKMTVESQPGHGAKFAIQLPLGKSHE